MSKKQLQMVNYLRKQTVWSMWFLLSTGPCGSGRSAKAALAKQELGKDVVPPQEDLHKPVPRSDATRGGTGAGKEGCPNTV